MMRMPTTQMHGGQVEFLMGFLYSLWQAEALGCSSAKLLEDGSVGRMVKELLALLKSISVIHREVNKSPVDHSALEKGAEEFCES
jgi:hypothetical protein